MGGVGLGGTCDADDFSPFEAGTSASVDIASGSMGTSVTGGGGIESFLGNGDRCCGCCHD